MLAPLTGAFGDVAQLGERCLRTAEVGGSNPLVSTTHPGPSDHAIRGPV